MSVLNTYKTGLHNFVKGFKASNYSRVLADASDGTNYASVGRRLQALLQCKSEAYDTLVNEIALNSDLISDAFAEGGYFTVDQDDFSATSIEISQEVADEIVQSINSTKEQLKTSDTLNQNCLHLTDNLGRHCVLMTDGITCDDSSIIPIVATTSIVEDTTDVLIYKRVADGKIIFNNLIRPNNYVSDEAFDGLTCNDALSIYCQGIGISFSGNTFVDMLRSMCNASQLPWYSDDTISDMLLRVSTLHATEEIPVLSTLNELYEYVESLRPTLATPASVFDFMKSLADSSNVNSFLSDVLSTALIPDVSLADINATVADWTSKSADNIRRLGSSINTSYKLGGAYGVVNYITQLVKSGSTLTVDENNVMQFTNNEQFVPQQFLSGAIVAVGETIAQVASIALMAVNVVLGAITSIVTGLLGTIYKGVDYSQSLTRASIRDDVSCLDAAPYGMFQTQISYNIADEEHVDDDVIAYLTNIAPICSCAVPGGMLLIGKGSQTINDEGRVTTYSLRVEFHPNYDATGFVWMQRNFGPHFSTFFRHSREYPSSIINNYYTPKTIVGTDSSLDVNYIWALAEWEWRDLLSPILRDFNNTLNFSTSDVSSSTINSDVWAASLINNSDERLPEYQDRIVRCYLECNILLYMFFMLSEFVDDWDYTTFGMFIDTTKPAGTIWYRYTPHDSPPGGELYQNMTYPNGYYTLGAMFYRCLFICHSRVQPWLGAIEVDPSLATLSWTEMVNYTSKDISTMMGFNNITGYTTLTDVDVFKGVIADKKWIGSPISLSGSVNFGLTLPKYDSTTFWGNVMLTIGATVLVAAATVAITVFAKRKLNKRRALNQAKVEAAHQNLVDHPSNESYKAYVKAVRRNNIWATFIGGTKYDRVNYWAADYGEASSASGSLTESMSTVAALSASDYGVEYSSNQASDAYLNLIKDIINLKIIDEGTDTRRAVDEVDDSLSTKTQNIISNIDTTDGKVDNILQVLPTITVLITKIKQLIDGVTPSEETEPA